MRVSDWLSGLDVPGPPVCPDEVDDLRRALDVEAARLLDAAGVAADADPVQMSKSRLAHLDRCERSAAAPSTLRPTEPVSPAMLAGRALDHFVAQVLVSDRVLEPMRDLRAAFVAHGDDESLACLDEWDGSDEGTAFALRLERLGAVAAEQWSGIDRIWAARSQVPVAAVFADGRLRVSGSVDVELGGPHSLRPGVVVEVKSGRPSSHHRHEAYLYGLQVALRDRVAPAVVAQWYPNSAPAGVPVSIGTLEAAAARLMHGLQRWLELLVGEEPSVSPGAWCEWCAVRDSCPVADPSAPARDRGDPGDELDHRREAEGDEGERW